MKSTRKNATISSGHSIDFEIRVGQIALDVPSCGSWERFLAMKVTKKHQIELKIAVQNPDEICAEECNNQLKALNRF